MVIIIMGLPGSGKSYFAERLAGVLQAEYASSDRIRKAMIPNRTYSASEKEQVYEEMLHRMQLAITEGRNIILDGTFYLNSLRQKYIKHAQPVCTIIFIEVRADESVIRERLKQPRADSEADFNVYKLIQSQWEPLQEPHLTLHSTNENITEMLEIAHQYIQLRNDKSAN
ncbi:AAA family ATPase [Chitinophaga sp.]|uniref:AAA family ATPase n=1 Tax=Chitinophaga sp. TaxID=1869181 RepID=UPI0031D54EE5